MKGKPTDAELEAAAEVLGVRIDNGRDLRRFAWLRTTVGDEALRTAVGQLAGARQRWPANIARVLRLELPPQLDIDPSDAKAFFASAKAMLSKKVPRS